MRVECIDLQPEDQGEYCSADVPEGTTVEALLVYLRKTAGEVGIFGKVVSKEHVLQEGERVEIYRPIQANAKALRKLNRR